MEILIFKTDIESKRKINLVKPLFNKAASIKDWSVDTEDIDNVLRIEGDTTINEKEVIQMLKDYGFYCESLPD